MPTAKKMETVSQIQAMFQKTTVAIAADYRGLTVADLMMLRRRLREAGVELHVVKNTLARIAAQQAEKPLFHDLLEGPTAFVVGFGDQLMAAKALTEYVRTSRLNLPIRGAVLDDRLLSAQEVQVLANLPPREVVLAQLMGGMQAPVAGLVSALSGIVGGLVRVLDARVNQMGAS